MSRLSRISLAFVLLMSSEVWALGLGDIRMNSALNEPLDAQIVLLSATPEELDNLTVTLAAADTFARYGIDRPFYLQGLQFTIVRSGRADGNYVQVRSSSPMAEPFLTFLVEASWARGRLLREYTVFLDPPTFAPPANTAPAVQAPVRSTPSDSARIERQSPPPQQQTAPQPAATQPAPQQTAPAPQQTAPPPVVDDRPFDTSAGSDLVVSRGDTLWGVASRVRPDSRLTMNQTMLAIFEANPDAFGGNINILRAGAALRIPSADEIFRINRADATAEAQRQHAEWGGAVAPVADTSTRPSLTLVPPDDDFSTYDADAVAPDIDTDLIEEPISEEQQILDRLAELEAAGVPVQQSLIEIHNNELASLRQRLADIRGEEYIPPVDDEAGDPDAAFVDDIDADLMVDDSDVMDADADTVAGADATTAEAEVPDTTSTIISQPTVSEPGLVDKALDFVKGWWMPIVGAVVVVLLLLVWLSRRGGDDEDVDNWQPLDADEMAAGDELSATETMAAPTGDESIVVVEQGAGAAAGGLEETIDTPAPLIDQEMPPATELEAGESTEATGQFGSLEDTFSSETAINLDQSDPIAEADFHMAYGLYDQAADLVNGALQIEPERTDLLTKLCEIYFVWGNRDAFIDAAGRLKAAVGGGESADWDKIVIMGQQIASDDALFAGASAAGATKAVDLSFEAGVEDDTGALDMDFGAESGGAEEVFDLGAAGDEETQASPAGDGVDFMLDDTAEAAESSTIEPADFDVTREVPAADDTAEMQAADATAEMPAVDATGEMPAIDATGESTVETPTIEQQFDVMSGTAELPSLDESVVQSGDETAEINLDDLGLDVDSLADTELANMDDLDATGELESLADTGINEQFEDLAEVTGKNPEIDPDATGVQKAIGSDDQTIENVLSDTGINEAPDPSLLDATGVTQVLSSDMAVDTTTEATLSEDEATMLASLSADDADDVSSDAETMLASLDDDEDPGDFDFAKTEALPKEAFTGEHSLDETGEMPAVASTDVELDLDDLTAALQVSEAGDTVEQIRDDATVEQPRPAASDDFGDDTTGTVALEPGDMDDDLTEARTMTEVGTKLDLARAYVDMGDPSGARSILEEVLDEGDDAQRQQAQQLLDSLPS